MLYSLGFHNHMKRERTKIRHLVIKRTVFFLFLYIVRTISLRRPDFSSHK